IIRFPAPRRWTFFRKRSGGNEICCGRRLSAKGGRTVSSAMAGGATEVMLCPPSQRGRALEVLYRRVPGGLRPRLIANALSEAERGLIALSGLWIAQRRGRILGALLTQALAGRAAAVWAPEVDATWWRAATAVALVRAALADLKRRGFIIAQALLDES